MLIRLLVCPKLKVVGWCEDEYGTLYTSSKLELVYSHNDFCETLSHLLTTVKITTKDLPGLAQSRMQVLQPTAFLVGLHFAQWPHSTNA